MVLRRITVDNSVRYIPKKEQTRENKPIMMKNKNKLNKFNLFQEEVNQTQENKSKIFQKIIKNLLKILQQEDLASLNE